MPKRRIHQNDDDVLKFFFEDVTRLPIINGVHDYLPLTRRIQRWMTLKRLTQKTPEATHFRITKHLSKLIKDFNTQCSELVHPMLDVVALGSEIESFLNDSAQSLPLALQRSVGEKPKSADERYVAHVALGLRCMYTLSLLPPHLRNPRIKQQHNPDVRAHFQRIYADAKAAKTQLVEGTVRYVVKIARSYINDDIPYLDLVQEGIFGLMHSADRYDEQQGHFQAYAAVWIKQRITRYISDHSHLVRVPVHVTEQLQAWREIYDKLIESSNTLDHWKFFLEVGWLTQEDIDVLHTPLPKPDEHESNQNPDYLKSINALSEKKAVARLRYRKALQRYVIFSMNTKPLYRVSFAALAPYLIDLDAPRGMIQHEFSLSALNTALSALSKRDYEILRLRFGMLDGEVHTLEEIATRFGLTRERIRQIEAKALRSLRHPSRSHALHDFTPIMEVLRTESIAQMQIDELQVRLSKQDQAYDYLDPSSEAEAERIDELIRRYIPVGRKGFRRTSGVGNIAQQTIEITDAGQRILPHCPTPLLPVQAHVTAFFESIVVGRELLKNDKLTAAQFWAEMRAWARNDSPVQGAFDAWYVTNLIEYTDYSSSEHDSLVLTLSPKLSVNTLRQHCVDSMCQRVSYMSSLLHALNSISQPTFMRLQQALPGIGHNLTLRLQMLAALDAIQLADGVWRLTTIGRETLQRHPAQDFTDLNEGESTAIDDLDELDMIDF